MNINDRKLAREFMMKVIFQMDARQDKRGEDKECYWEEKQVARDRNYCDEVFTLWVENADKIDAIIESSTKDWDISRLAKVDLAILRISILEILYMDDINPAVSINEGVNLAKLYGGAESPKFVNAILGKCMEVIEDER